jgi:hypothetical protein
MIIRLEGVMVLKATFNNISAMSLLSILLVEENGVVKENHRSSLTNYHIMLYLTLY